MTYVTTVADKVLSSISFSGTIILIIVALVSGAAAWITYPVVAVSDSASFNARFFAGSASSLRLTDFPLPLVQSLAFATRDQIATSKRPAR
jgi:hypothetical protein